MTSSQPPKPGIEALESFLPASRLNRLAVRSPSWPSSPMIAPIPSGEGIPHHTRRDIAQRQQVHTQSTDAAMRSRAPRSRPSQVLPGLSQGMSLCLPIALPVKYAPMSHDFVTRTSQSTIQGEYEMQSVSQNELLHAQVDENEHHPARRGDHALDRSMPDVSEQREDHHHHRERA